MALPVKFAQLPPGRQPMALFDQQFDAVETQIQETAADLEARSYTKTETDALVDTVAGSLTDHIADLNNPHATTAHQVNAYTQAEVDGLIGRYGFQVYPASGAITVPSGIANGSNYWVQSADGNSIVSYTNNAGTPGLTAGVNPLPTVLGTKAITAAQSVADVKASIRRSASLKLLLLAGIGITEFSAGVMASWSDQSGNGLVANMAGQTVFSGANPRPVIGSALGAGIDFNGQAGLNIASGVLAKTDNFAIHFPFQMLVTPGQSYASLALMNAGASVQCDIAQVTGGPNTTFTPDIDYTMQGNYTEAQLVKGFYQTQFDGSRISLSTLWSFNSPSGYYLRLALNKLGQPLFLLNGPGGQTIIFATGKGFPYNASVLDGLPHLISVARIGNSLHMFMDGKWLSSQNRTSGNIMDLNVLYINGPSRVANALIPVNGIRHTEWGMQVIDNCDWQTFRDSHDAMARAVGTPLYSVAQQWILVFVSGQSLAQGATVNADSWVNPNGWNGMITKQSTNSGEQAVINRSYIPDVLSNEYTGGVTTADFIGPVSLQTTSSGTAAGLQYAPGAGVETIALSAAIQIRANPSTPPDIGFIFINVTAAAGFTLLTQRSTPPYLVQNVKNVPTSNLTQYEFLMKQAAWVHDTLQAIGGDVVGATWWAQMGAAQLTGAQTISWYDQVNPDLKRLFNLSIDVDFFIVPISVSTDGTSNAFSIGTDQAVNDAVELRGTRPIYGVSGPGVWSNHFHYYRQMYAGGVGEQFGKTYARVKFNGENWQHLRPKQYTIAGNTIKIQMYLATGRQLVFKTNANNIDSILQTGGFNTYGFSYVGGGLTFAADVALATTTTTNDSVLLTFSGPPGLAGHVLSYIEATRYGNIFDDEVTTSFQYDQDWTVPIVAGQPVFTRGLLFDLANAVNPFRKVF